MNSQHSEIETELRQLPLTSDWPPVTVTEIGRIANIANYPAGTVIFREGTEDPFVHVVLSGRVALEMTIPARGAARLMTLDRGELLGWTPLFGPGDMTASATAIDDTRLLSIPGSSLQILCQTNHEIGYQVMRRVAWALARRLVATRLQLLDLFTHSTPEVLT